MDTTDSSAKSPSPESINDSEEAQEGHQFQRLLSDYDDIVYPTFREEYKTKIQGKIVDLQIYLRAMQNLKRAPVPLRRYYGQLQIEMALDVTKRDLDGLSWVISTLRRLPTHVLIRIFDFVVNSSPVAIRLGDDSSNIPRNLALVCSSWRKAVNSAPKLWSKVDWRMDGTRFCSSSHLEFRLLDSINQFDRALRCSENYPLDISLHLYRVDGVSMWPVFQRLHAHLDRIRSLDITMSADAFHQMICILSRPGYPSTFSGLTYLSLNIVDLDIGTELRKYLPINAFSWDYTPNLQHLTLKGPYAGSPYVVRLPWARMTTLELSDIAEGLPILSRSRYQVQHLRLVGHLPAHYLVLSPHDQNQLGPCVNLPRLETLQVTPVDPIYAPNLLWHLSVPALRELRLEGYRLTQQFPLRFVQDMLQRSTQNLSSLYIHSVDASAAQWCEFFSAVPCLKDIHFDDRRAHKSRRYRFVSPLRSEIFDILTAPAWSPKPIPLPRLQMLAVSSLATKEEGFASQSIISVATTRQCTQRPLKSLSLTIRRGAIDERKLVELLEIESHGVEVTIQYISEGIEQ